MDSVEQYRRNFSLIVFGNDLNGLDLSELRVKFTVKRSDVMTPNTAEIRIYNVEQQTALKILTEYGPAVNNNLTLTNKGRVLLQAGYDGNSGVIFAGNIKQVILGRESATDTFVDLVAGDGDRAYNYSVVNTTLDGEVTPSDQVFASVGEMAKKGVTAGHIEELPKQSLPRGKVMFGNARNYLRTVAESSQQTWSIQNEKVTFVPLKSYLPGGRVVLTSKTGLIGTPQQTNEGVNVKCLLNPFIKTGGLIDINEASVSEVKINLNVKGSPANLAAPLSADGVYYVFVVEYEGDTRGVPWYSSMLCLRNDPSANPRNSVQGSYGG